MRAGPHHVCLVFQKVCSAPPVDRKRTCCSSEKTPSARVIKGWDGTELGPQHEIFNEPKEYRMRVPVYRIPAN